MSSEAGWSAADAWILAALSSGRGTDLSGVIAGADAINHAIPTREELSSSLGALIACGWAEIADGRFRLTADGKRVRKHWKGGLFAWTSMLPEMRRMGRPDTLFPIEQSDCAAAYEAYRALLAKTLRRLEGGRGR